MKKRLITVISAALTLGIALWSTTMLQKNEHMIGAGISRATVFLLINAHIMIAIGLIYLIIRESIKLFSERSKGDPGRVFKKNLLFAFALFSVIPSIIISITAGKFITTSIDTWFHTRISAGLQSGIDLHRAFTKKEHAATALHGDRLASMITNSLPSQKITQNSLDKLCFQYFANQASTARYEHYYVTVPKKTPLKELRKEVLIWRNYRKYNDRTTQQLGLEFIQQLKKAATTHGSFDFYGSLYWVTCINDHYFILVHRYNEEIRNSLITIQNSLSDYQQLKSIKNPIYTMYLFTYLIITLLILLLSLWCAFYLAHGISQPILALIQAMQQVHRGNLDVYVHEDRNNDLRSLVHGFNTMTRALKSAYQELHSKNEEMSLIIKHIQAGALLINRWGRIVSFNKAAESVLALDTHPKRLINMIPELYSSIKTLIKKMIVHQLATINSEISTHIDTKPHTFIITISVLPRPHSTSVVQPYLLIVIDDITEVVNSNRLKTWQEAAKQMAHEIKNPLTPIQLATQRLQKKYGALVSDPKIFSDCTTTILEQVALIKDLAAHFSEFASLPTLCISEVNVHKMVEDLTNFYKLSYPSITFYTQFSSPGIIKTDLNSLKRVLVNLFDNSVRVLLQQPESLSNEMTISIETKSTNAEPGQFVLTFTDNGPGIKNAVKETLFLPYVSTERKNMGLGLAIVHDTIKQLGGSITLAPTTTGTSFVIILPS